LDISFASQVTDEGINYFKGKEFHISELMLNGLTGISAASLNDFIGSTNKYLRVFEGSLMD